VVFSGPLLSREVAEPLSYADSLLQGFGEDCMAAFLSDYKQGRAKRFYRGDDKEHPRALFKTGSGHAALSLA
jgi:hypothetical protein